MGELAAHEDALGTGKDTVDTKHTEFLKTHTKKLGIQQGRIWRDQNALKTKFLTYESGRRQLMQTYHDKLRIFDEAFEPIDKEARTQMGHLDLTAQQMYLNDLATQNIKKAKPVLQNYTNVGY
jgi:hypothetical protein